MAGILTFSTANLLIATVLLRRRPARPASPPVLEILAWTLIVLVIMAAAIIDAQLVIPAAPAIGRPALSLIGAVFIEVVKRLFATLPNAPRWLLGVLRILEILLVALAAIGIVLAIALRRPS